MERTLSPEEKIRRAEEIYARRKNVYTSRNVAKVNVSEEKNNYVLLKKIILQIAICVIISFIFYLIKNSNYVFSEEVLNKTKEILSYDIDIPKIYTQIIEEINNLEKNILPEGKTNETNQITNNISNNSIEENKIENVVQENAIGGAQFEDVILENDNIVSKDTKQQTNEKEIEQTDAEYIKSKFSFLKPVEGVVSSEFGLRDSSNPIVSKNHTGIDIAANTGTVIKAAMEGTVSVSSTVGEYGHHIKIVNGDITTLYAHCSKLYVKEGEYISKGQEIAEVGSTGNSTAPHLHFEIIRGSTYINPRNVLEF